MLTIAGVVDNNAEEELADQDFLEDNDVIFLAIEEVTRASAVVGRFCEDYGEGIHATVRKHTRMLHFSRGF